jgi:hypothetical protein
VQNRSHEPLLKLQSNQTIPLSVDVGNIIFDQSETAQKDRLDMMNT